MQPQGADLTCFYAELTALHLHRGRFVRDGGFDVTSSVGKLERLSRSDDRTATHTAAGRTGSERTRPASSGVDFMAEVTSGPLLGRYAAGAEACCRARLGMEKASR